MSESTRRGRKVTSSRRSVASPRRVKGHERGAASKSTRRGEKGHGRREERRGSHEKGQKGQAEEQRAELPEGVGKSHGRQKKQRGKSRHEGAGEKEVTRRQKSEQVHRRESGEGSRGSGRATGKSTIKGSEGSQATEERQASPPEGVRRVTGD
ncbi:hypothetical protein CYMTET_39084 [Cymbomonas tetramitiformis]|uniref:Uncharacterized protein n=1 Tax=Cymbomonas tetramitiformis TaxID=36881 RepID=A0AAE0CCU2_9CHLO|nr:hypothetical protein CYMTET_39084 [Cymbomonas tetramitiformis]